MGSPTIFSSTLTDVSAKKIRRAVIFCAPLWAWNLIKRNADHIGKIFNLVMVVVALSLCISVEVEQLQSPGGEVYELAKVTYGEARGESFEGQRAVMASVFNRVEHRNPYFPNTVVDVIHQPNPDGAGCAYRAVCDVHMEDMSTSEGKEILQTAFVVWVEYRLGIFRDPTNGAHSYCVPRDCKKSSYFAGLKKVRRIGGHDWYTDQI